MSVPWMLLARLTDDELAELHGEYKAQLQLVADEMVRRAVERQAGVYLPATVEFCSECGCASHPGVRCV